MQPRRSSWSTFEPTGSPIAKARQIATQVSSEYKLPTGRKLLDGRGQPTPDDAVPAVRLRTGERRGTDLDGRRRGGRLDGKHEEGDFTAFDGGSTVAYQMCGFGSTQQNCGIVSEVTANRGRLLRREALELSLYTLKYVPGTNAVLTYLPSPAGDADAGHGGARRSEGRGAEPRPPAQPER